MSFDPKLARLADLAGVVLAYDDVQGHRVESAPEAVRAILTRFGYAVESEVELRASLERAEELANRLLSPTIAAEAGVATPIHLRGLRDGHVEWRVTLEDGLTKEGRATTCEDAAGIFFPLDALPEGYHRLHVRAGGRKGDAFIIAAPPRCHIPEAFELGRGFGITAQVYGLRSPHNFGIGDFSDIGELAEGAGRHGACFLGLSPVNALFPTDRTKISPYSPSSRHFIDPIYIDPRRVAEFAQSRAAHDLNDAPMADRLETLRQAPLVDYAQSWSIKREILGTIWPQAAQSADDDFASFRAEAGEALDLYATFEALSERFSRDGGKTTADWPEIYRDPQGEATKRFRIDHSEAVAFHAWLQWLANLQMEGAQARAKRAGMAVGLYRDLAVGADPFGAEAWARPDWFLSGLSVGAPPDLYNPQGQNWGLLPFDPLKLEEQGLEAFRALLKSNMRHAGAIRIDHAFQLQRLYVVPTGLSPKQGAYIRFPFAAMLAVIKLESKRHRALVIAEDLGTAPGGFSDAIMQAGILSSRVLPFERDDQGRFNSPSSYQANAVAAVATHDLPTFAGFWSGADIALSQASSLLSAPEAEAARSSRDAERKALTDAFAREGLADEQVDLAKVPHIELNRFLARTKSMLVALQLEDILELKEQANVPSSGADHPNWRRKLPLDTETILAPAGPLAKVAALMAEEGRQAGAPLARPAEAPPRATYRLQFHKGFTFSDAIDVLPYIAKLGVSHIYASPILKARPGSTHGYDAVDPQLINPELGGAQGFALLSEAIRAEGMKLLLDIVPNHMGVGGSDNRWWLSVLEWGPVSPVADTFDIDWDRLGAHGKLVAPFLGGQYGDALEKGDLKLAFDADQGSFSVWHFEHRFPICPLTYPDILDRAIAVDAGDSRVLLGISEELRAMAQEPVHMRQGMPAICERFKRRIAAQARHHGAAQSLEQAVALFNGTPGIAESFNALHRLLEQQSYRLSYWRVAASDINYRRFFDIDGLAGVRIEKPAVFERMHERVFDLVRQGMVDGLRIDHIDGLADPKDYAHALQRAVGPNFYVVVEKIVEPGEDLRNWPIAGTTGYEMLNLIDGLFVDADAEPEFDAIYDEVTGASHDYVAALRAAKSQVLQESFSSELESLVSDMKRIADANRLTRDFSVNSIRIALADFITAFPIYRTYITPSFVASEDRALIADVLKDAMAATALPDRSIHEFIAGVLLGAIPTGRPGQARAGLVDRLRRRFQQLTGPVMAKSLEDTLFYRYVRFLALNEVGGEPHRFGVSPAEFHAFNTRRAVEWPSALSATATHDTKRGEDARARLIALTDVPALWREMVTIWRKEASGVAEPDANDQYMLLQTIVGAWPLELLDKADSAMLESFRERLEGYIPKAFREGKRHSKWIEPNEAYEAAAKDLIGKLLSPGSSFVKAFTPLMREVAERGMIVSLARTILKCTVPGVPDFYQGTGLWDFSLVDPDNRRPVDFLDRWDLIEGGISIGLLFEFWRTGAIKLHLTRLLLSDRRERADFYAHADHAPLAIHGSDAEHYLAFVRSLGEQKLVVVVPRLQGPERAPLKQRMSQWGEARVDIPSGRWRHLLDGRDLVNNGSMAIAELFETVPFAVLVSQG